MKQLLFYIRTFKVLMILLLLCFGHSMNSLFCQEFDFYAKDYPEGWIPVFPKALFISGEYAKKQASSDISLFPEALFVPAVLEHERDVIYPKDYFESRRMQSSLHYVNSKEEEETERKTKAMFGLQSPLLNSDLFALYGHPLSTSMGLLGRYRLEQLDAVMQNFVEMYDAVNGERKIIPALYIIYGTCWPKGEIGILNKDVAIRYIEYAAKKGWYVFLDDQIGKYTVEQSMNRILPFLKYDNVHLAIDPEWRTLSPMETIGSVTASEVNKAQKMMNDYMIKHNIKGRRFFVIHQFHSAMIQNRHAVRTNFERVQLIHCSDGFGPPRLKKATYAYNAIAKNLPLKSFKLFLPTHVVGAGYDVPVMSPKDVMNLKPRPYFIMYQ